MTGAVEAPEAGRRAPRPSGAADGVFGRQSISEFLEQHNRSSSIRAKALHATLPATARAAVLRKLAGRPVAKFLQVYVKDGGWRDGLDGWLWGALSAWCEFLLWAKWWEASLPGGGHRFVGRPPTPQDMGPPSRPWDVTPDALRARDTVRRGVDQERGNQDRKVPGQRAMGR